MSDLRACIFCQWPVNIILIDDTWGYGINSDESIDYWHSKCLEERIEQDVVLA